MAQGTLLRAATPLGPSSTPPLTSGLLADSCTSNPAGASVASVCSAPNESLWQPRSVTGDGEPTRDSISPARSPWTKAVIGLALVAAGAALVATFSLGEYVLCPRR